MLHFHRGYALATLILLLVETAIALWLEDGMVRYWGGDVLAVTLAYCGLRAVTQMGVDAAAFAAFAIACAIEVSQRYHLVDAIGLGGFPAARAVFGTGFDPHDFIAYAAGVAIVLLVEHPRRPRAG